MKIGRSLGAVPLAVLLWTVIATAQTNTSLSGRVLDGRDAAVAGARVRLWHQTRGLDLSVRSDEAGAFHFDNLVQGDYNLSIDGQGFSIITRRLTLSHRASRIEIVMEPAAIAEQMLVASNRFAETPETLKHIPGSVGLIDQLILENARVFTFSEALRKVPGIQVRDEEGLGLRPNIGIRGLNPTRSGKVLLLEDGVPLTYAPYGDNASYYHPPIDRFESIEVLKGSGQILYGPVTLGGVINYITPNPPQKPSGYVTVVGGNRDYFNGHVNYGGTWGGTGLLFDYMRKQGEGARQNVRSGLNDFNFKLLTAIGSRQALILKANHYSEDSNVTYSGLREDEYRIDPRQNPFRNDEFYGDRFGASATHTLVINKDIALTTSLYGQSFRRDWWRQSSNSAQRPNDGADPACGDMTNLNTTCGNEGRLREYKVWGVEPRLRATHRLFGLNSNADLGFRLHSENQDRRQENGNRPTSRSGVIVEDNQRRNQAFSGFLQNRFLAGNLAITPGVRFEHVRYERTNRLANDGLGINGRTALTQAVPGLGISYSLVDRATLFAGVHRGFAPPRTEDIISNTGGSIDLHPELSWNYEVGLRSLLHPGVRLEATFFRMDYENQIVPASLAGGVGAALTNGGETLHQGAELSARVDSGTAARSRHNLYLQAAVTYLPVARFTGTRFSNISGFGTVSISGNRLPYAPKHLLTVTAGYSAPSGFEALVEAVRVSDQFGDDLNTRISTPDGQRGLIPRYIIWNAAANYRVEAMHTTLFVTVKNLLDRTFIVDRARGILPGSPRLIQGGLKFRF